MSSDANFTAGGTGESQPTGPANERIGQVASGQKLIIYAVLVNVVALGLQASLGPIWGVFGLLGAVLAIVGLVRLGRGLDYSTAKTVLLIVLAFIPLVSLIMLLIVNSRATKELRAAGYRVGLLGTRA